MFKIKLKFKLSIHLEHVLTEGVLVVLAILLVDHFAELREVDVAVPDDVVGQVDDLLLHGVEAEHLHGRVQILDIKLTIIGLHLPSYHVGP